MFVPASPSQVGDTPGSVRRQITSALSGHGEVSASGENDSNGSLSPGALVSVGRMIDRRRISPSRADNASSRRNSSSSDGGRGSAATAAFAMEQKPHPRVTLSEATQAMDGEDWRLKVASLRQIHNQLAAGSGSGAGSAEGGGLIGEDSHDLAHFTESLGAVCRALKDTRPEIPGGARIAQLVCSVVSGLAKAVGSGFCTSATNIIPELLPFLSSPREGVQEAVLGAVGDILAECHSPGVLRAATVSLVGSKKAHLRRTGSSFLCVAVERWPRAALRTALSPIMSQMRKALFDADATVRREGRHTFAEFIRTWPAEGGGMYHALDRANQRAVLQEQPHVSNFIKNKTQHDGAGGGGIIVAGSIASLPGIGTAGAAAVASAQSSSDKVASAPDGDEEGKASVTVSDAAAAAAAAASAATRMVMASGRGGGGGQRPAGVTQAQHRSLVTLKLERDRRLRDQQRLAAAGVTNRSPRNSAVAVQAGDGGGSNGFGKAGGGMSMSSVPAAMNIDPPRSPRVTSIAAGTVGGFGCRSPAHSSGGGGGVGSPRIHTAETASSCSEGLRKAARLALRKNDLMSPTMKRLLRDPSQLRTAPATDSAIEVEEEKGGGGEGPAVDGMPSPGSEESGLDTVEEPDRGDADEVALGDVDGDGGRSGAGAGAGDLVISSELRGSTIGRSPLSIERDGGSDSGESFFSSSSSSSSDEDDGDVDSITEDEGEGGKNGSSRKGRRNLQLPSRVLFGQDGDKKEELKQGQPSPKLERISAIARAAASASAARNASREMNPPPPRLSTAMAAKTTATTASLMNRMPASGVTGGGGGGGGVAGESDGGCWRSKLGDLASPRNSNRTSVDCTPTRGILVDRSGKEASAAAAAAAVTSSTVKRRVRFETEEQARRSSSSISPARRPSSFFAAGLWSRAAGEREREECSDSDDDECESSDDGGEESRRIGGGSMVVRAVLSALAVASSVGVVAFLGAGGGGGGGHLHGSGAPTFTLSRTSPEYPSARVPTVESLQQHQHQHQHQQHEQRETCLGVDDVYSDDGGGKPNVATVDGEDGVREEHEHEQTLAEEGGKVEGAGESDAEGDVAEEASEGREGIDDEAAGLVLSGEDGMKATDAGDEEEAEQRRGDSTVDAQHASGETDAPTGEEGEEVEVEGGSMVVEAEESGLGAEIERESELEPEPELDAEVEPELELEPEPEPQPETETEEELDHDLPMQSPVQRLHRVQQDHPLPHNDIQDSDEEAIGSTDIVWEEDSRGSGIVDESHADTAGREDDSPPPSTKLVLAPSTSVWGWFEVGAAMVGAAALLAAAVVIRVLRSSEEWLGGGGGGEGAPDGEATDGGSGVDGEQLGRYETVEMVKTGGTPATLRSVRRSRRIGSAQKPTSSSSGTVIMDLGTTALDLSRA